MKGRKKGSRPKVMVLSLPEAPFETSFCFEEDMVPIVWRWMRVQEVRGAAVRGEAVKLRMSTTSKGR